MSNPAGNEEPDARPRKSFPLAVRWALTRKHLQAGYEVIRIQHDSEEVRRCLALYLEFLAHNELECALNMLECACESFTPTQDSWQILATAAESMELYERASALRRMGGDGTS